MDLVCGLDNRLPRLLFAPWAKTPDALRNPLSFLSSFEDIKAERILEWLPLFHSLKPAEELDSLIEVLGTACGRRGTLLEQTPAIEVPFTAEIPSGAALCDKIARLWQAFPDLTRTLGLFTDGYVKHFYHLKELWHLAKLTGRPLRDQELGRFRRKVAEAGGNISTLRQFEQRFFTEHASLEGYARWRAESKSAVLEFDLDSIADTHECQSPVFLDGEWIVDRQKLFHGSKGSATGTSLKSTATQTT